MFVAYDPGPTPGTGLIRNSNFVVRAAWWILGNPLFIKLIPGMNSRMAAGNALADLALGKISAPERPGVCSPSQGKDYMD